MSWKVGEPVLVKYDGGDGLWHERVLCARVKRTRWIAKSPDECLEDMDFRSFTHKKMLPGRKLPAGIHEKQCYLVSAKTGLVTSSHSGVSSTSV